MKLFAWRPSHAVCPVRSSERTLANVIEDAVPAGKRYLEEFRVKLVRAGQRRLELLIAGTASRGAVTDRPWRPASQLSSVT